MGFLDMWKPLEEQVKIIKTEFNDVEGLNNVIGGLLSLKDSEIYGRLYQVVRTKERKLGGDETAEDLLKLQQFKYATKVIKKPVLYLPPLSDVIIATHFLAILSMIGFIRYTYNRKNPTFEDLKKDIKILERLMISLDKFDTVKDYKVPDEEFYRKLKDMKWDKRGKELFGKLNSIRREVTSARGWGSAASTFRTGEMFMLGFLAACNAVNHERSVMLTDDVICAYKTYFKLLNTDISRLEL